MTNLYSREAVISPFRLSEFMLWVSGVLAGRPWINHFTSLVVSLSVTSENRTSHRVVDRVKAWPLWVEMRAASMAWPLMSHCRSGAMTIDTFTSHGPSFPTTTFIMARIARIL